VIRVAVRENEEVEFLDFLAQALQTKFRRRVHLHVQPVHHDVNRNARAPVARSLEAQTAHSHAIIGTPCEVPVPRKMTSMITQSRMARIVRWKTKGSNPRHILRDSASPSFFATPAFASSRSISNSKLGRARLARRSFHY